MARVKTDTPKAAAAGVSKIPSKPPEHTTQIAASEPGKHDQITALAYEFWIQRGCPIGSPEEDWFRAERELSSRSMMASSAA